MNTKLLIDAFVRQTMVLIAQVATMAGVRTPLAHVANQVFLDLTTALEQQGLGRKVVADMFGLALRSYQQKVDRITESASSGGVTLWEAVHSYLAERGAVPRAALMQRFARDDAASVAGILRDLVESGLVYKTGRGEATVYRIAPADDVRDALASAAGETAQASRGRRSIARARCRTRSCWTCCRSSAPRSTPLSMRCCATAASSARMVRTARSTARDACCCHSVRPPAGRRRVIDHYHTVVGAICAKLRNGQTRALPADQLGGSTFSFDIWPGHPHQARVLGLLKEQRQLLSSLWDEVARHNESGKPEPYTRVSFYCGQLVTADSDSSINDEVGE